MENVIGEIWSELEEGSVPECPVLDLCVRALLAKVLSYLFVLRFRKMSRIIRF